MRKWAPAAALIYRGLAGKAWEFSSKYPEKIKNILSAGGKSELP
jgi:hypothetical protein